MEILIIVLLSVIAVILVVLLIKKNSKLIEIIKQYKDIVDIDLEVKKREKEIALIEKEHERKISEQENQNDKLYSDYASKKKIYQSLLNELSILEENLEDVSFGLYKPHFSYDSSENYKQKLQTIFEEQKSLIKNDLAVIAPKSWSIDGSSKKGMDFIKQFKKLLLRAFNGESDSAIAKVNWNNVTNMEARILKSFEQINKAGINHTTRITDQYLKLKLNELYLEFELKEKLYKEKEEQRMIKEQLKEEEKALREIERAQKEAEEEEFRYQKAIEKAKQDLTKLTGSDLDRILDKIKDLETKLKQAQEQKERAMSMAQQTKSGYVYIISNIGSFGEDVYKIGMTRRLEPTDRVKELGDASVPFSFDIHALIYSQNAPELENTLHKVFNEKRLNMTNLRREFFNVKINEINDELKRLNLECNLINIPEAKEYRESISIKETSQINDKLKDSNTNQTSKFPDSLND